ncbi:hypothetical protein FGO68_gene15339 [Halteria grandinella]|uniref:Uncharacterized protein n=1 Tax=Halteria grandinella TaxID=5974 RepID=A0A8J8SV47_HALGN|nr:hypothetical protein FGO68_gene15339 [Halteria grandinella]
MPIQDMSTASFLIRVYSNNKKTTIIKTISPSRWSNPKQSHLPSNETMKPIQSVRSKTNWGNQRDHRKTNKMWVLAGRQHPHCPS